MRSSFIDRILRKNSKIKAKAQEDKQKVAKNRNQMKNAQQKETVTENVALAKESRVLPID